MRNSLHAFGARVSLSLLLVTTLKCGHISYVSSTVELCSLNTYNAGLKGVTAEGSALQTPNRVLEVQVTKACVTALVGSIYHAQVYYSYEGRSEVWMDARPSDAINLAVRFRAPIYVNKGVAVRMAAPLRTIEAKPENESQVYLCPLTDFVKEFAYCTQTSAAVPTFS